MRVQLDGRASNVCVEEWKGGRKLWNLGTVADVRWFMNGKMKDSPSSGLGQTGRRGPDSRIFTPSLQIWRSGSISSLDSRFHAVRSTQEEMQVESVN